MNPIWATVEKASARLTLAWVSMTNEANSAVNAPAAASKVRAEGVSTTSGLSRRIRKPPALMMPACINAETGVGVSIVSGSQLWNGNCADFSIAHSAIRKTASVTAGPVGAPAASAKSVA